MVVFLVVTHGRGSMDLYSLRLSHHLNVPTFHTDVYQRVSEQFGRSAFGTSMFKNTFLVIDFLGKLNGIPGIPHLPNHHLGRFGYLLKKPFIITVHDIIRYLDIKNKDSTPLIHKPTLNDRFWLSLDFKGSTKAAKIIVPSNHTKMDLIKHLNVPEEKIKVIYHGVDEVFKPTYGRRPCLEPYILYVGSEHPRKNIETVLKAFHLLKKDPRFKHLKFVKVGRIGGREENFREKTLRLIESLKLEKDVVFVEWIPSPKELASFYTQAELFVFPSIYEGFGWPPLEAMACGCPVISSDVTAMPEILGSAAVYVSPYDVEGWYQAMVEVLTDDGLKKGLSVKGMERAKLFDWKKTAEETLKVYREVDEAFGEGKEENSKDKVKAFSSTLTGELIKKQKK